MPKVQVSLTYEMYFDVQVSKKELEILDGDGGPERNHVKALIMRRVEKQEKLEFDAGVPPSFLGGSVWYNDDQLFDWD